jgi:GAF domain-containing protein
MSDPDDELLALLHPDAATALDPLFDAQRLTGVLALRADEPDRVQPLVEGLLAQAAAQTGSCLSLLNVVLTGTQVVSGAYGLRGWLADARATPAEWSLCATVVRTGAPYVVADLSADPRHADNPLCTVDGLRSYAGVPLHDLDRRVLGALCVLDTRPRQYSRDDLILLRQLADRSLARLVKAAQQEAASTHASTQASS